MKAGVSSKHVLAKAELCKSIGVQRTCHRIFYRVHFQQCVHKHLNLNGSSHHMTKCGMVGAIKDVRP